jgi:hypothetical protein
MNLISGTHNFCEKREYAFNVLLEYSTITQMRERRKREKSRVGWVGVVY